MPHRSTDDLLAQIERGQSMAAVLDLPAFREAVDHLSQFHLAAMVACRPGYAADADALAYHHTLHHALTELVGQMTQWAAVGEQAQRAVDWTRENGDEE